MKRRKFRPEAGAVYENHGGGTFKCLSANGYNAVMRNVKSGWQFVAHVCYRYENGQIDWNYSTEGRFAQ